MVWARRVVVKDGVLFFGKSVSHFSEKKFRNLGHLI
nr:MAG TPA: hypothetical protein [Caudoviricetes sp.]